MKVLQESNDHGDVHELSAIGEAQTSATGAGSVEAAQGGESIVQELAAIDGGWKAWRFCAAAFAIDIIVWGFEFSYGIFQDYYTSNPPFENVSSVAIAAVGTTALALQYGETLFLSLFFERYPDFIMTSAWFGLALASLSLLMASFATKMWQLVLLQGVCYGIGGGLIYFPIVALLPQWFSRRRGLAAGIIFSGSGIGGFVFPYMLEGLLAGIGFRWTLRTWSAITLVFAGIALLGMKPRLPVPKFQRGQRRPRFIPPQLQFIKTPHFWALGAAMSLQSLSYYPISLYIPTFTKGISTPLSASIVLSLFNSSGVVCQILIGHLCDRLPYAWIMAASTFGSGLAVFLLWGFAHTLPLVIAFAIIFGGLMGGFISVGPVAAADCAGNKPEQSSLVWACSYLLKGITVVVGPIITGMLYDMGSASPDSDQARYGAFGFKNFEIFVGACAIATSVASVIVAATRKRARV
ncbi:MFS general substrate transporter [Wolfiporia cocos MD-104 SS10]|uniref:MFS general substrate transporter n=1 Tax=Wolfiporia cocos (strain MD-104) TaxID=742152 RepID=A0A2H3J2S3_WOLCO|nr:MFS general substrate transporter [Wolfiporia cocos MD-104 SS10]